MSPQVIAAIVAGVFSILAPIIAYYVTQAYQNRIFQPFSGTRAKALIGKWKGQVHQEVGPEGKPMNYPSFLEISVSGKVVSGTADMGFSARGKDYKFRLTLRGGFSLITICVLIIITLMRQSNSSDL